MNILKSLIALILTLLCSAPMVAQSMYGDAAKADVKMRYVYSLDEAMRLAKKKKKLIFFNCFVDWAVPCHGMNKAVFSNKDFAKHMDSKYVNLFVKMTSEEGKKLAERYGVKSYAHYLVLDANGEVVHRIAQGAQLPWFQEMVDLSLSDNTSLRGTTKRYAEGCRDKDFLYNYARALSIADQDSLFRVVGKQYISAISTKEYSEKKNWMIVSKLVEGRQSTIYKEIIARKAEFVANIGEEAVNNVVESQLYWDAAKLATGSSDFTPEDLAQYSAELQSAALPDSCMTLLLHKIGVMRTEKDYQSLINFMNSDGDRLGMFRPSVELTFNFPRMTDAEKQIVGSYLRSRADKAFDRAQKLQLSNLADMIMMDKGIKFVTDSYSNILARAKKEGKLIFLDCYTFWCGPCKMMANTVFTRQDVGNYFNEHFICTKIDMEKGEGPALAKTLDVYSFPTMMFIDGDGNIVHRFSGACSSQDLIRYAQTETDPAVGYSAMRTAYQAGKRDPHTVYHYVKKMKASGELSDDNARALVEDYCKSLPDSELSKTAYWNIIKDYANDANSEIFSRIVKHYSIYAASNSDSIVSKKIEKVVFPTVLEHLRGQKEYSDIAPLKALIETSDIAPISTVKLLMEIIDLHNQKRTDDILSLYSHKVPQLTKPIDRANLDALLHYFVKDAAEPQRQQAITYATEAQKVAHKRVAKEYTILLEKLNSLQ